MLILYQWAIPFSTAFYCICLHFNYSLLLCFARGQDWFRSLTHAHMRYQLSVHNDVIKWQHFPRNWPFVREFTDHLWIPRTKASDAQHWCFFYLRLNKRLSKQSWGWWFETPSRPLWRHCNWTDYFCSSDAIWRYGSRPTLAKVWIVTWRNKLLRESVLTYHQGVLWQFHKKWSWTKSVTYVQWLHFKNTYQNTQGLVG